MDTVNLGRTGLRVSRACLGTMTFGRQADEAEATRIVDRALDAGVTFLDTADAYPIPPDSDTNALTPETPGPTRSVTSARTLMRAPEGVLTQT